MWLIICDVVISNQHGSVGQAPRIWLGFEPDDTSQADSGSARQLPFVKPWFQLGSCQFFKQSQGLGSAPWVLKLSSSSSLCFRIEALLTAELSTATSEWNAAFIYFHFKIQVLKFSLNEGDLLAFHTSVQAPLILGMYGHHKPQTLPETSSTCSDQ